MKTPGGGGRWGRGVMAGLGDLCQVPYTLSHKAVCTLFGSSKRKMAARWYFNIFQLELIDPFFWHDLYTNGQMIGNSRAIHRSTGVTLSLLMQFCTALSIISANLTPQTTSCSPVIIIISQIRFICIEFVSTLGDT